MLVLVSGCAGFIGSHLSERLLAEGHDVVGLDALTDYYDPALKRNNLLQCLDSHRFHFLNTTIAEAPSSAVRDAELIYHLAAQPGVRSSWGQDFRIYVEQNILSTQILLEQARAAPNLKRLVYASSSSVYGNTSCEAVSEQSPKQPHSPYGVTKLAAEQLCTLYADNYGIPAVAIRIFTACGPRQRPDMMLHRLIQAALSGTSFTVFGDGEAERDFTAVMDIVDAFLLAGECSMEHRVFNISGNQVVSMREVFALVEEIVGSKIKLEFRAESRGDVRRTGADITRALTHLHYCPKWNLRDTIQAQIQHVEGLLRNSATASVTA